MNLIETRDKGFYGGEATVNKVIWGIQQEMGWGVCDPGDAELRAHPHILKEKTKDTTKTVGV